MNLKNQKPNLTEDEACRLVEQFLNFDAGDESPRRFIELMTAIADGAGREGGDLAISAARHAYTLTHDFEDSFARFCRLGKTARVEVTAQIDMRTMCTLAKQQIIGAVRKFMHDSAAGSHRKIRD